MFVKCDKVIEASLDNGLTVTAFPAGDNEVPDWVGEMAKKHYGAEEVAKLTVKPETKSE